MAGDLLDMSVLEELRALDEDDLRELVELYVGDVVSQLEHVRSGLPEKDGARVSGAAHRIKGASLSIGAASIAEAAAALETSAKQGEFEPCTGFANAIENDLDPTRAALVDAFAIGQTD